MGEGQIQRLEQRRWAEMNPVKKDNSSKTIAL
jgi:hypothetical protein